MASEPKRPTREELEQAHEEGTILHCGTGRAQGFVVLEHPDPSLRGEAPVGPGRSQRMVWVRVMGGRSRGHTMVWSRWLRPASAEELLIDLGNF